jgi:HD-GYP domain-containing protein (c-di-GMP phosphodiesterase class II)
MTHEKAISEIIRNSGIQFDPHIVDVFVNLPHEVFTRHSAEAAPDWVEQAAVVAG